MGLSTQAGHLEGGGAQGVGFLMISTAPPGPPMVYSNLRLVKQPLQANVSVLRPYYLRITAVLHAWYRRIISVLRPYYFCNTGV